MPRNHLNLNGNGAMDMHNRVVNYSLLNNKLDYNTSADAKANKLTIG